MNGRRLIEGYSLLRSWVISQKYFGEWQGLSPTEHAQGVAALGRQG